MPLETISFEPEAFFPDSVSRQDVLQDAFATCDAGHIAHALGVFARHAA